MKKLWIFLSLAAAALTASAASPGKNSVEYKDAYQCATESIKSGSSGPASYCVGNSRDPSPLERQAYADAERDFKQKQAPSQALGACPFGYAIYTANGSHADQWREGEQKAMTLNEVANLMTQERPVSIRDQNGQAVSQAISAHWFERNGPVLYGQVRAIGLSAEVKRSCSKKQIGG